MRIVEDSLESEILRKRIKYRILFPQDIFHSEIKANPPVLYLLHGLFGESGNWTDLTEITDFIKNYSFAAVAFNGGNSWYINGIDDNRSSYESFFIEEFVPQIENVYKIGGKRENRAIAGISMGGYGALKFALKSPSLFNWAGSMSGAFDAPRQNEERPGANWEVLGDSITAAFGEKKGGDSRTKNDLFQIISEMKDGEIERLPNIYFDCGRDDSFIDVNRELFELMRKKKIVCSFFEQSGGHEWNYWNRQLKSILRLIEEHFKCSNLT